jgi:hypothetical protein
VKYPDDLMLLAKEERVLEGITGRLVEVGKLWNGNEYGKTEVMGISKQPSTSQIMTDKNNRRIWNI